MMLWRNWGTHSSSISFILVSLFLAPLTPAQVIPDETLPNPSTVRRAGNTQIITGGTQAGSNLFHSFRAFSPRSNTASFQGIDPEVSRIFTRVTGASASRIDGVIEALQTDGRVSSADFFLLNPNGILFGQNAALNLGGSFLATTGESIRFADGIEFNAVSPQITPLLSVNVPIGLQFGQRPGRIRNESVVNLLSDSEGTFISGGLEVLPGRTLALIGGDVVFFDGVATAPAGRLELGAVGSHTSPAQLNLSQTNQGWRLNYRSIENFQDIRLAISIATATGTGGGSIQIQGEHVILEGQSSILSNTLADADGGMIKIRASHLNLDEFSEISSLTQGSGRAANVDIRTNQLTLLNGGQINTLTFATGHTGTLTVNARDFIEIAGGQIDNEWFPSGLLTQVRSGANGMGGNLSVTTNTLRIQDGAQINTTTFGSGDAGRLRIRASTIEIEGRALQPNGEPLLLNGLPFAGGIFSGTGQTSTGKGGNLVVSADRILMGQGSTLQTATFGSGDAGNLTVRASEWIEITSRVDDQLLPSALLTASGGITGVLLEGVPEATGRGGRLFIRTPELRVLDGAVIAVGSLNPNEELSEGAGNLEIEANTIRLENQGQLLSETASGDGGGITLRVRDDLVLRQGSRISTTAGVEGTGGDGGNIRIRSDRLLAEPTGNSDITANAFTGRGGNVRITTNQILGIEAREQQTPFSDITASSELGVPGEIVITSPEVDDPNRGLVELPGGVIDVSQQIAQRCPISVGEGGEVLDSFTVVGRGGLPANPNGLLERVEGGEEWVEMGGERNGERGRQGEGERGGEADGRAVEGAIAEAQGWVVNGAGAIELVAHHPVAVSPASFPPACQTP